MGKRYNERCATHYELMPKELIDMCLECKRIRCTGNCRRYEQMEREVNQNSSMVRGDTCAKQRGIVAERYPFRGEKISAKEMAERVNVSASTVRRYLGSGLTMEEVYRLYACKNES